MSIKSEIARIQNNVANSLSAVRSKGVSVPAGANSDNLPGLIAQISGGAEVEEITNEAGGKSVYINSEVPEVSKLPEGYTRLQYIQSSGTQYVNTGFKPNQDTRVVIDLQGATTASGVYGMHYGVKQFMAGKASKSSWNYYVYYGSQEVAYATRTANDFATRHTIDHNKNVITTGGVTQTLSAETFSSSYNMYLFGANNDGSLGWAGTIRVFACKIWDNGTIVRDYVPCLNASNVAGLYDMVNGVFYGDAAGGSFIAGPVVGKSVSKVVLEDQVLIDLTSDTVTPEALLSGFTAHDAMGRLIQGAASSGSSVASGSISLTSSTISVSGLSFQPKIVIAANIGTLTTSGTFMVVYDQNASVSQNYYIVSDNAGSYYLYRTSANVSSYYGGFTITPRAYSFISNKTYRWYAIG